MLPSRERIGARAERRNLPVGVVVGGAVAAVLLLFFGWVALGIGHVPDQQNVTVDVPVKG